MYRGWYFLDVGTRSPMFDSVTHLPGVMTDWSALPDVDVFRLPIP